MRVSKKGTQYWEGRQLMPRLGYKTWESFNRVINKARISCLNSGNVVSEHFREVTKVLTTGQGAQLGVKDILLDRYACYLVAQNGSATKQEIASAEYGVTESKWRFLQGLRYGMFAGISAGHGTLVALYMTNFNYFTDVKSPHGLGRAALMAIPIIALSLMLVGVQLERRLRLLYSECSERGSEIEREFGDVQGIFTRLQQAPSMWPLTHTNAIYLFTAIIAAVWLYLLYASFTTAEGVIP